jgi:hypothetical protein
MTVDICFSGNLLHPPTTPSPCRRERARRPQKPSAFATAAAAPEKWPTINLALSAELWLYALAHPHAEKTRAVVSLAALL